MEDNLITAVVPSNEPSKCNSNHWEDDDIESVLAGKLL